MKEDHVVDRLESGRDLDQSEWGDGIRLGAMLPSQDVSRKNPARRRPWKHSNSVAMIGGGPDRGLDHLNACMDDGRSESDSW